MIKKLPNKKTKNLKLGKDRFERIFKMFKGDYSYLYPDFGDTRRDIIETFKTTDEEFIKCITHYLNGSKYENICWKFIISKLIEENAITEEVGKMIMIGRNIVEDLDVEEWAFRNRIWDDYHNKWKVSEDD